MKKSIISFIFLASLVSCISLIKFKSELKQENSNKQDKIVIDEIDTVSCSIDISNPEVLFDNHDYIAIVHIDNLNPAKTYREKTNEYILPYTSGSATILKGLKGNFKNSKINFLKLGGLVSAEEYKKSLAPEEAYKFNKYFVKDNKNIYVNFLYENDIHIEQNKNYLAYMNRDETFHDENEYSIEAFGYGLREIKMEDDDFTNIFVKNNITGEFEPINEAVSSKLLVKLKNSTY